MAKAKGKSAGKAAPAAKTAPVATPAAPATTARLRMPFPAAKTHNSTFAPLAAKAPVIAANIALTAKGTNPKKARVYGYANLANGGGVPKAAKVAVVAGYTGVPAGVNGQQWELLKTLAGNTVEHCYANKVTSRTVRRAFRAGAINFVAA